MELTGGKPEVEQNDNQNKCYVTPHRLRGTKAARFGDLLRGTKAARAGAFFAGSYIVGPSGLARLISN